MPASSEPQHVAGGEPQQAAAGGVERIVVLGKHLHARPAGQLAQAAARHRSTVVELVAGSRTVNARSVLAVMGLGAVSGSEVRVRVSGPDAAAVADEIVAVLTSPDADG